MNKYIILIFLLFCVACQSREDGEKAISSAHATETAVSRPPVIPAKTAVISTPSNQTATPVDKITLENFVSNLKRPIYMTHAGDDTLYVAEQEGTIRMIADGELQEAPFLDISEKVNHYINEQGLLGLALHPDFAQNGTFFVYYSTHEQGNTVLVRYQTMPNDPLHADPTSETILLTIEQPDSVHNAGQLQFGPDGYLYVGIGDGGLLYDRTGNGQNTQTLLGSILRLDVDAAGNGFAYGIPETNPFVNGGGQPEIWSYGWRNPWRFSFDRQTGDLFVGDVGEFDREEISQQPAASVGGENYGWNVWEGNDCFQAEDCDEEGFIFPIFEFLHTEGCAIIGGYMYRGQQFPAMWGNYFLADYCTGKIWRLFPNSDGSWQADLLLDTDYLITSFAEDKDGELYVLAQQGHILRLTAED